MVFFLYSRKVNDSNDSFNIRANENSSSRDDIKTPNISDSPSSAELSTDDEIHPRSNEMRFANFEEIRWDYHLFDERRYEKEYTWLYYNFNKVNCAKFVKHFMESQVQNAVIFKDNPGKKVTRHDESESH